MTKASATVGTVFKERPNIESLQGVYISLAELIALQSQHHAFDFNRKRKSATAMVGSHRSHFRGRGIDFDEVRVYQPGDDVRNIDWRVTARTGSPHTKLFREERERPIYILVDQSQRMFFGSQLAFKSVTAAQTAAYLAWGSRAHNDRIGGFVFNDQDIQEIRPKEGKKGIQLFLRVLAQFNQQLDNQGTLKPNPTALRDALERVRPVVRPGSMLFLIGDLLRLDDHCQQQLSLISRHSDVLAVNITDPMERELPPPGAYSFTDGEQALTLSTQNRNLRKRYKLNYIDQQHRVEQLLLDIAVPLIHLSTAHPVADSLQSALGQRKAPKRVMNPHQSQEPRE